MVVRNLENLFTLFIPQPLSIALIANLEILNAFQTFKSQRITTKCSPQ